VSFTPSEVIVEIAAPRAATSRPFAVNVPTLADDVRVVGRSSTAVLDAAPPVITLSFGEPARELARCRDAGLLTLVRVQDIAGLGAALEGQACA
jgi:hypothetical protein